MDRQSSQEYPINSGVPEGSILSTALVLLYNNNLPDDAICDIAIYVDDTSDMLRGFLGILLPPKTSALREAVTHSSSILK